MIKRNMHKIVFYLASILLIIWLSFFVEPVYSRYANVILFILFFITASYFLSYRKNVKRVFGDKLDIFLWLYILIMTIGIFLAENRQIALHKYVVYAVPIPVIYYFFKSQVSLMSNKKRIAEIICVSSAIVSCVAILEFIFHKNLIYEKFVNNFYYDLYITNRRVMSTLHVPQVLGTYIVACVPMSFFLMESGKNKSAKIVGIITVILCLIALVLTFSRGPIFALFISSAVYLYRKNKKKTLILIIGAVILLVLIFSIFGTGSAWGRLGLSGWVAHSDYQHRWTRVGTIIKILKDHPFIGLGLENYRWSFDKYFFIKDIRWDWRVTDNMYLLILGESGLIGFFAFMAFIVLLLKRAFARYSEFGFVILIGLIGILCNMLTYDLLYWTVPFYIFWIYCGICSSMALNKDSYCSDTLSHE